jgi:hypothetical protein
LGMSRSSLLNITSAFVAAVILLQAFRNYSGLYFVILPFSLLIWSIIATSLTGPSFKVVNGFVFKTYLLFVFFTLYIFIWSYLYGPEFGVVDSAGRLFFSIIIPLIFVIAPIDEKKIEILLKTYLWIYVLGALSYFYQFYFGPIEWFADEPMERGSLFRFSTILGSGNIYGIGVGVALLLIGTLYKSNSIKVILYAILFAGAFMSLQKAAVVNIFLWFMFVSLRSSRREMIWYITGLGSFFCLVYLYGLTFRDDFLSLYIQEFVFNSFGLNMYGNHELVKSTVLDKENLIERFLGLHLDEIFDMHNPVVILVLGVGLMGAGGGMGLPQYPQAHSTLWDIFFMGGLGYLIIFLLLFISTIKRLKLINSDISKFLIIANYIFFINLFSATAAIYQPVLSFTFWMSVLYAVRKVDRVH